MLEEPGIATQPAEGPVFEVFPGETVDFPRPNRWVLWLNRSPTGARPLEQRAQPVVPHGRSGGEVHARRK